MNRTISQNDIPIDDEINLKVTSWNKAWKSKHAVHQRERTEAKRVDQKANGLKISMKGHGPRYEAASWPHCVKMWKTSLNQNIWCSLPMDAVNHLVSEQQSELGHWTAEHGRSNVWQGQLKCTCKGHSALLVAFWHLKVKGDVNSEDKFAVLGYFAHIGTKTHKTNNKCLCIC